MTTPRQSWLPTAGTCLLLLAASSYAVCWLPAPWGARSLLLVAACWPGLFAATAPRAGGWLAQIGEATLRWAMLALVLLPHLLFAENLVGPAVGMLRRDGGPGAALWLAGLLVAQIVLWWRWWPAPGLIWADRLESEKGRWRSLGLERVLLLRAPDQFWRHGLWIALALAGAMLGAGLLAWLRRPLPAFPDCLLAILSIGLLLGGAFSLVRRAQRVEAGQTRPLSFLDDDAAEDEDAVVAAADSASAVDGAVDGQASIDAELLEAARRGDGLAVEAALRAGADANARPDPTDTDQRDALTRAAACGQIHALRALLQARAEVNPGGPGPAPLLAATQASFAGRPEVVLALLANGADPNVHDDQGRTPLHHAALCRDPAVAQALLDAGARIDVADDEGFTALARAAEQHNLALIEHLLNKGAKLEPDEGIPALLALCQGTHDATAALAVLLKRKPRLNATDGHGLSALQLAAKQGHAALVEALLEAGADVSHCCQQGRTALHWAADQGHERVLQRLAFWQPPADVADNAGDTALHLVVRAERGSADCIRLLLALGAAPGRLNGSGKRAIDLALANSRWPLVRALDPSVTIPSSFSAEASEDDPSPPLSVGQGIPLVDPDQVLIEALRKGRDPLVRELLRTGSTSSEGLTQALLTLAELDRGELAPTLFDAGLDPVAGEPCPLQLLLALQPVPKPLVEASVQRALQTPKSRVLLALASASGEQDEGWLCSVLVKALAAAASPTVRDSHKRSPLHHALLRRNDEFLETLLRAGPLLNATDCGGIAPLHLLALRVSPQNTRFARAMVRAGADPGVRAADGRTPAGMALQRAEYILAELLDWPALAHPARALREADLARAARAGDRATVRRLLQLGLSVDGRDERGASALVHAAGAGHLELVTELLAAGADPAAATASGATALSAACVSGHKAVIGLLITSGVPVDQRLREGLTPLMIAASVLRTEMVELLLERGAQVNAVAEGGLNALEAAVMSALAQGAAPPALACVRLLLERGAKISVCGRGHGGLLHRVLGADQTRPPALEDALFTMLELLLARGADLEQTDNQSRTALHWACRHSLLRCAELLIDRGAQPTPVDDMGQRPFDLLAPRWRPALGAKLAPPPRPR